MSEEIKYLDIPAFLRREQVKKAELRKELADAAIQMLQNLRDEQRPMPPEFQKVLDDNFWNLI